MNSTRPTESRPHNVDDVEFTDSTDRQSPGVSWLLTGREPQVVSGPQAGLDRPAEHGSVDALLAGWARNDSSARLEDLAFRYLHTAAYEAAVSVMLAGQTERERYFAAATARNPRSNPLDVLVAPQGKVGG